MARIDVVPSALVAAAAATCSFARQLQPVELRAGAVSEALDSFTSGWTRAVTDLVADAELAAAGLQESAATYMQVESLLVPRVLR